MPNRFLIAGATMSAIGALLHLGCIAFGPSWYRFFGAGERMVQMAEAGQVTPIVVTVFIVAVLGTWSLVALSGAGVITRLPLLRTALGLITAIYLLRGLAGFVLAVVAPGERGAPFWFWSSAICLVIGAVHFIGVRQAWPRLAAAT